MCQICRLPEDELNMMGGPLPSGGSRSIAPGDGATEPPDGVSAHPGAIVAAGACGSGTASQRPSQGAERAVVHADG